MSNSSMAPCGLICEQCPAYIATRSNDTETLLKCGKAWGQSVGREITAEEVKCDGCRSTSGRKWLLCKDCTLIACGKSAESASCAHCSDYPCDKVNGFDVDGRKRLETMHAGLISE